MGLTVGADINAEVRSAYIGAIVYRCGCGRPESHLNEICPQAIEVDLGIVSLSTKDKTFCSCGHPESHVGQICPKSLALDPSIATLDAQPSPTFLTGLHRFLRGLRARLDN